MSARREVLGYRWHLRRLMAEQGMFKTSELRPLLAERGIELSAAQVYRLVTQDPERLNVKVLVALCDILTCAPNDLIEPIRIPAALRKTATDPGHDRRPVPRDITPRRARITPNPDPEP